MKVGFYFSEDERGWLDKKQQKTVSTSPLKALGKANGNYCWIVSYPKKQFLIGFNAESLLRRFAKDCALDVIHLWSAPEVVKEYLRSDSEELRVAARVAAGDAARDAAWGAVWGAARDAAWGAARDAAWNAAWGAAWGATRDAAMTKINKILTERLISKMEEQND